MYLPIVEHCIIARLYADTQRSYTCSSEPYELVYSCITRAACLPTVVSPKLLEGSAYSLGKTMQQYRTTITYVSE
jgi:hypothetical protein